MVLEAQKTSDQALALKIMAAILGNHLIQPHDVTQTSGFYCYSYKAYQLDAEVVGGCAGRPTCD